MAGVSKIEIRESEAELKELLRQEKTGSGKETIQVLYLLAIAYAVRVSKIGVDWEKPKVPEER